VPFAPHYKVSPELQEVLSAAKQVLRDAGLAAAGDLEVGGEQPAAATPTDEQQQQQQQQQQQRQLEEQHFSRSLELGPPEGEETGGDEQERRETQQGQQQVEGAPGGLELAAHAAVLAHPVVRQLRAVPRGARGGLPARALGDSGSGGSGPEGRVLVGVRFASITDGDLERLAPGRRFAPAEAAAEDWGPPLAALGTAGGAAAGCGPLAHAEGTRSLTVSVCAHELAAVVDWLSAQPQAHWLEPRRRMRLHNRIASAVAQGALTGAPGDDPASPGMHPLFAPAVGLRGEGQVVGVGDSGLDMDSCYFFDPTVSFKDNTKPEGNLGNVFTSATHRKVAYYIGRSDTNMLDGVGHGTHVCGTIAGLPLNTASDSDDPATGQAPGARLGFIDLSSAAGNDVGVPDDLNADYFPMAYSRGTRIHSGECVQAAVVMEGRGNGRAD
jgi:hypothetical protein